MQTEQIGFLEFLGQPDTRFTIPLFQRVYSWGQRECEEFWDDVMAAGRAGTGHFMGVVLYAEDAEGWKCYRQLNVIDGQQRMTTMSLLLVALAHLLREGAARLDGVDAGELYARYLRVGGADGGEPEGKLALTYLDRYTLFSLVGELEIPEEHAQRIIDNYALFAGKMREPGFDVAALWRGLQSLQLVAISLTGDERPQLVFESLNAKGMSLVTGDLVRNQVLMAETAGEATGLYERCWEPLEQAVWDLGEEGVDMSMLIASWLAERYRSVRIHDEGEVYSVFKAHLRDECGGDLAGALGELEEFAGRFVAEAEFREAVLAKAHRWIEGKPERFVSELKLFGD